MSFFVLSGKQKQHFLYIINVFVVLLSIAYKEMQRVDISLNNKPSLFQIYTPQFVSHPS